MKNIFNIEKKSNENKVLDCLLASKKDKVNDTLFDSNKVNDKLPHGKDGYTIED